MVQAHLPIKTIDYLTELTDTRAWDHFELRPDDVIVATPPKCGTTWTQSLVMSLIFGKPGMDKGIDNISRWLDPGFRNLQDIAATFNAQTHRRCIKTHTPLDGIPYVPSCQYIVVYRHPIDAHFSMRRHMQNLKQDIAHKSRFPDDPKLSFRIFLEETDPSALADGVTLDSIVHHYKSFKTWERLPNIHLFHYADMRRDLPCQTARLAGILRYDHAQTLLDAIADSQQFEQVKQNAEAEAHHAPQTSATFHNPAAFFDSGTSAKWVGKLTEQEMAVYRHKLDSLLEPADRRWLEHGNSRIET